MTNNYESYLNKALPPYIWSIVIIEVMIQVNKKLLHYAFLIVFLEFGFCCAYENTLFHNYKFHIIWVIIYNLGFIIWLVQSLEWQKVYKCFILIKIWFIVIIHFRYGVMEIDFYVTFAFVAMFYFCIWILVSTVIKGFMKALFKNENLLASIGNLLRVFPEAVVIWSEEQPPESEETVTRVLIVNDSAKDQFYESEDVEGELLHNINTNVKIRSKLDQEENNQDREIYGLSDLIEQRQRLVHADGVQVTSQIEVTVGEFEKEDDEEIPQDLHYYEVTTISVKWEDNDSAFMHVFVDITAAINLEKERTTNNCLHTMFTSISHEFRTPVNAFSNALELLESRFNEVSRLGQYMLFNSQENQDKFDAVLEQFPRFLKIGNVSVNTLMGYVEDILDFARIEAGTFSLNYAGFYLETLWEDLNYIFEDQWKHKGIEFLIKCDQDLLRTEFVSDLARVKQILMNLVSNAFKFTQAGSIVIGIEMGNKIREDGELVRALYFSVEDTGIGISKEETKKLFKMFGMANRNPLNIKGTGLGLTISKKLTESLGGEISLESEEQKGTIINFSITEERPSNREESKEHPNALQNAPPLHSPRIQFQDSPA